MLGMIQQQTHFTQRSLVYQEGGGLLSCGFKYYKIHSYNILAPSAFLPVQLCPEKNIQRELQCTKEVLPQLLEQGNNIIMQNEYFRFCVHIFQESSIRKH